MNLITLQKTNEGTMARNLSSYGTDDGALSALYQGMRASINDTKIKSIVAMLISDDGVITKREFWERAEEQTEEA